MDKVYYIINENGSLCHNKDYDPCFYDSVEKGLSAIKKYFEYKVVDTKEITNEIDGKRGIHTFEIYIEGDFPLTVYFIPVSINNSDIISVYDTDWYEEGISD